MTAVSIDGEDWLVDGLPTHAGRHWREHRIEGLLLNSRMANAVFDDANPLTRHLWAYPDTANWDPQRNTDELIAMLPTYRSFGLDAICVNLQGGAPAGYYRGHDAAVSELMALVHARHPEATPQAVWAGLDGPQSQPWDSGAIAADGSLKPDYMARTQRLLEAADHNGLVVMLGIFYFGQDERLRDEAAVRRAVEAVCDWVLGHGFENVLIEVNNECNIPRYEHASLTPARVHELITLARSVTRGGRRLLAGTSFARESLPTEAVVAASDFVLVHGNSIDEPAAIAQLVDLCRAIDGYAGQPILFNEDDHFDFEAADNNFLAAVSRHCGWGFFDPGFGAGGKPAYGDYVHGYQNPPVNWALNTERKASFFRAVADITGAAR